MDIIRACPETATKLKEMAGMSASSNVSAASDLFDHESDVDSDIELTDENESTQKQTVLSLLCLI